MSNSSNFNALSNQNLLGFVPALVIDYLLEKLQKKEARKLPEKQTFSSVAMFADISGFTNLSEKLSKRGPEGTELLAFALNRYMELLVMGIGRSGGDIFKFAGDAIIIVWPPPPDKKLESLIILCRQALQSALDIQGKLNDFKIIDDIKLSVKIGFGVGQITIVHVGGVFQRAEYLPTGPPLAQAFECEHLAKCGGVVIASKQIWEICSSYFEFEQIIPEHEGHSDNGPFFYVKKVKKSVKMKADAILMKNKCKPSDIEAIRQSLQSYVPAAVVPYIEIDQEKWSAELRRLSVLFVNLGIDLKDAESQEGLIRIQQVIETVQNCVYSNQGSLNKFLMDDKGSTLIILFGLPPMAHQDDPIRAVLTAINMHKSLKKINCSCSVGVTTGTVFVGVVGTSGSRREFSVLGDSVNLSARFMQMACSEKEKKVLVDEATKMEAEHKLAFRFVKKAGVKGKTGEIPFFEPIYNETEPNNDRSLNLQLQKLRIHRIEGINNPIFGEKYESETHKCMDMIDRFLSNPSKNYLINILGGYGVGKTAFVLNLIEKMAKKIETDNWKGQINDINKSEKTHVIINNLNSVQKNLKLNGFRDVFQEIFQRLIKRKGLSAENLLITILESEKELINNMELVADILGVQSLKNRISTSTIRSKTIELDSKIIKNILLKILKCFLGEENDKSEDPSAIEPDSPILNAIKTREQYAPLILILDDMHDYDPLTLSLVKKILKNCKKILIITIIRTEFLEIPIVFKKPDAKIEHKKKMQELYEGTNSEDYVDGMLLELEEAADNSVSYTVDLVGFTKNDLEILLNKQFGIKMIESYSKTHIIKSIKEQNTITDSTNFLDFLYNKSTGCPLDTFILLKILISFGYIEINQAHQTLFVQRSLLKCLEIEEYLTLLTPLSRIKINIPMFDRFPCTTKLILKTASVIGDCFDLQTLWKVNRFKEQINKEKLLTILNELEKQEFIEVLDQITNNVTYRFTYPFMREVIYQSMIYNQRRNLHRCVAEAIQAIPSQVQTEQCEKLESERLIFHWCMAENVNPFISELQKAGDFSNKAKRSIIVKKISSLLMKNPNSSHAILKKGILDKKSDRGYSWAERYCIITTREFKYYYKEDNFTMGEDPLGAFALKNIYSIMPIEEAESKGKAHAFVIYVGSWFKKNKDMGIREFYFSARSNDELEQWTTYIEFIKAKAIYDDFVNTFGKISFPLGNTNEKLEPFGIDDNGIGVKNPSNSMSRLTLIAAQQIEKTSITNNSVVKIGARKKTSVRRTLIKDRLKNLNSNLVNENQNNDNQAYYTAEYNKKLKERLIGFFNSAFMLFWSHIIECSDKYRLKSTDPLKQEDGQLFGLNSHLMNSKSLLIKIDKTLFDELSSGLLDKRVTQTLGKLLAKSSFTSNDHTNESFEDITNSNNLLNTKQIEFPIINEEKLEKIDEVSETRESLMSRTGSMNITRRGTGYFDSHLTTNNKTRKISSDELETEGTPKNEVKTTNTIKEILDEEEDKEEEYDKNNKVYNYNEKKKNLDSLENFAKELNEIQKENLEIDLSLTSLKSNSNKKPRFSEKSNKIEQITQITKIIEDDKMFYSEKQTTHKVLLRQKQREEKKFKSGKTEKKTGWTTIVEEKFEEGNLNYGSAINFYSKKIERPYNNNN